MMSLGACAGFMAGYLSDNFLVAILASAVAGMFGALIYGVLTVTFMANQNVTGLTMTIFGVGLSNLSACLCWSAPRRDAEASGDNHGSDEKY